MGGIHSQYTQRNINKLMNKTPSRVMRLKHEQHENSSTNVTIWNTERKGKGPTILFKATIDRNGTHSENSWQWWMSYPSPKGNVVKWTLTFGGFIINKHKNDYLLSLIKGKMCFDFFDLYQKELNNQCQF